MPRSWRRGQKPYWGSSEESKNSESQSAELLLGHYPQEKSEAIAHVDFAISEFREMKMQPWLGRALRHKEILKA
jgi:hypothetical protein